MDPAELAGLLTEDELLASLLEAHESQKKAHAAWMEEIKRRRRITAALHARGVSYIRIAAHLGITDGAVNLYMKAERKEKNDG